MEKITEIAKAIGVLPKLRLSEETPSGGRKANGSHTVKFLEEPVVVMGKDQKGNPRKELKFKVQEGEQQYYWRVPILNKEGQPNYLFERLLDLKVGEERILEMKKVGMRSYIDVSKTGEEHADADEEGDEVIQIGDEEIRPEDITFDPK